MSYSSQDFSEYVTFNYIQKLYSDYQEDIKIFNQEILSEYPQAFSLFTDYTVKFNSIFLLSAANSFEQYFESEFPKIFSAQKENLHYNFLLNQALKRKYFTLFNWREKNANQFFGLFGSDFKSKMTTYRKQDENFEKAESQFLLLGQYRNLIVHSGMNPKTVLLPSIDSVYEMFTESLYFCDTFFTKLSELLE